MLLSVLWAMVMPYWIVVSGWRHLFCAVGLPSGTPLSCWEGCVVEAGGCGPVALFCCRVPKQQGFEEMPAEWLSQVDAATVVLSESCSLSSHKGREQASCFCRKARMLLFIDMQCSGLWMRSCKTAVRSRLSRAQSCPSWDWQSVWAVCILLSCGYVDGRVVWSISPLELLWSLLGQTQHGGPAFSVQLSACYACGGQNLHLEELVIKIQQDPMSVRIADGLCGQGERGWQVRTCSSGDCCVLFPPSQLSSMMKERIIMIPAVVHVLKLFGMPMSKPTLSCVFLTRCVFVRGECAAHAVECVCWSNADCFGHTSNLRYLGMETK